MIAEDFPFLGACYGIGTLGSHQGAVIDRRYAEPVGAIPITLTPDGRQDPVFGGLPEVFEAFVGHKEAISRLPRHAVLLAGSKTCPVQAFRIGSHVYATQFHPELDVEGLCTRVDVYKYAGYFAPEEADEIKALARASTVVDPPTILRRFVDRYAHSGRPGRAPTRPVATSPRSPADSPRTPDGSGRPGPNRFRNGSICDALSSLNWATLNRCNPRGSVEWALVNGRADIESRCRVRGQRVITAQPTHRLADQHRLGGG